MTTASGVTHGGEAAPWAPGAPSFPGAGAELRAPLEALGWLGGHPAPDLFICAAGPMVFAVVNEELPTVPSPPAPLRCWQLATLLSRTRYGWSPVRLCRSWWSWRSGLGSGSPFGFGLSELVVCVLGLMPRCLLVPGVALVLLGRGWARGRCQWDAVPRTRLAGLRHETCMGGLGLC